tara:strand:- start:5614 stop:6549 length:936 start_codon:yes stop_codon:yes gene_type:complete
MQNLYKINGNPEQFSDLNVFHKLSQQFLPYAQERLGFDKPVGINLLSDPQNAKNPLGKTAYYDPNKMEVTVFVDKRHVKDILRSMSHELVHHTQNCRGEFEGGINAGEGYAQKDPHMRKMEEEAYLKGQMLLRDFEDNLKENKVMAEGKKMVKGPDGKMVPDYAVDGKGPKDLTEDPVEEGKGHDGTCKEAHGNDPSAAGHKKYMEGLKENENDEEDKKEKDGMVVDSPDSPGAKNTDVTMEGDSEVKKVWKIDGDTVLCDDGCTEREARARINKSLKSKEKAGEAPKNENWTRKNKDQLLFERLVKLWTK